MVKQPCLAAVQTDGKGFRIPLVAHNQSYPTVVHDCTSAPSLTLPVRALVYSSMALGYVQAQSCIIAATSLYSETTVGSIKTVAECLQLARLDVN